MDHSTLFKKQKTSYWNTEESLGEWDMPQTSTSVSRIQWNMENTFSISLENSVVEKKRLDKEYIPVALTFYFYSNKMH